LQVNRNTLANWLDDLQGCGVGVAIATESLFFYKGNTTPVTYILGLLLDCTLSLVGYHAVLTGVQFLPVVLPHACPVVMSLCFRTYSWSSHS